MLTPETTWRFGEASFRPAAERYSQRFSSAKIPTPKQSCKDSSKQLETRRTRFLVSRSRQTAVLSSATSMTHRFRQRISSTRSHQIPSSRLRALRYQIRQLWRAKLNSSWNFREARCADITTTELNFYSAGPVIGSGLGGLGKHLK